MDTTPETRSGFPVGKWLNERLGLQGMSYSVPEYANSLPYTLGGITLSGFLILILTGIYLAQFYHPETTDAHQSVIYIITQVPLGDIVRSIHFWTAQIVTGTMILHLLRVLFSASYKRPRELNWIVGLGLLAVTFGLVFTGSVLKIDQEGVEAFKHNKESANLVSGLGAWFSAEFSRSVPLLTRLFDGHVTILPLIFAGLIAAHIYLIKQHGISPKPTPEAIAHATTGEGDSRFSAHLRRIAGYGLLLLGVTLILSLIFPAPLGQPGVAGAEITKPWWMFIWLLPAEAALGVQALIIFPILLGGLLILVPFLDRSSWLSPARRKGVLIIAGLILLAILVSGIYAVLQPVSAHLMK